MKKHSSCSSLSPTLQKANHDVSPPACLSRQKTPLSVFCLDKGRSVPLTECEGVGRVHLQQPQPA